MARALPGVIMFGFRTVPSSITECLMSSWYSAESMRSVASAQCSNEW